MTTPNAENTIIHVDMDAFYASVEQRNNPAYQQKPIIVGGTSQRGVVCSASYEARAFGVRSAMPMFKALQLCPQAVVIAPQMDLYHEESDKIHEIFLRYTPIMEPISLDEAYLEVGGSKRIFGSAENIGRQIQNDILTELQLNASVGIAPNKFLAKIASDLKKPKGFCIINYENCRQILDPMPVTAIGGIGKKTAKILETIGVYTIADLRQTPLSVVKSRLGNQAETFLSLANGQDHRPVVPLRETLSISHEQTLEVDLYDKKALLPYLLKLADNVGTRLRHHNYNANTIVLKIRRADFSLLTRSITIEKATQQSKEIYQHSLNLLNLVKDIETTGVRLIGVGTSNLKENPLEQLSLFEDPIDKKQQAVENVIDSIRSRFGHESIFSGSTLFTDTPIASSLRRKSQSTPPKKTE